MSERDALIPITDVSWQSKLDALGEIVAGADDVGQQIRLVLATRKGSVPLDPEFGSRVHDYLDWPLVHARPHLVREAADALAQQVPGAVVVAIAIETSEDDPSQLALVVQWVPADGGAVRVSYVALGGSGVSG